MSDALELRFLNRDPQRNQPLQVTLDGKPLHNVNELEWSREIYANVCRPIDRPHRSRSGQVAAS